MKIKKAVVLAAGFGTRFLPITKAMPKEMMPIIDKPVIQYVVEECISSKITDIILVTGRSKRAIEDHFDHNWELESLLEKRGEASKLKQVRDISQIAEISYVRQKQPGGVPDAIYAARNHIGSEPFAVLFGDDILIPKTKPHLQQLIEVAEKFNASCVGSTKVPLEEVSKFGVISGIKQSDDLLEITNIVEKPSINKAESNWVSNGRYVFTNEYLDLIPETPAGDKNEKHWPDVAIRLLKKQKMYAKLFDGQRYSVGDKLEFLKATFELALQRPDVSSEFKKYLENSELFKKIKY